MTKILKGGMLWQPSGFQLLDVVIQNGVITDIGSNLSFPYATEIDCRGGYLIPGIVDMHVHAGEKIAGYELADDYKSLSALAEKTGIAAIGAFITELHSGDGKQKHLLRQYQYYQMHARKDCRIPIRWHLTPTVSDAFDILPLLDEGCDLKFYTTYREGGIYRGYDEIERWMQDLSDLQPRMLIHCEDDELIAKYSYSHPFRHAFDHTLRRPESAEIRAVEKVLELAVRHNYPIHIVHVSSPQSAKLIKQAKAHAPITCETAPHYLLLSDACLSKADGHRWLCTPPLRNENSRGELVEHLQDGVFDAIATDHCPFTIEDKDRFASIPQQVPNGLASLGATLPVLYEGLVKTGKLSMESLVNLICVNPWQLLGLPDADIILQTGYQGKIILTKDTGSALPVPSYSSSPNIWTGWTTGLEVICV